MQKSEMYCPNPASRILDLLLSCYSLRILFRLNWPNFRYLLNQSFCFGHLFNILFSISVKINGCPCVIINVYSVYGSNFSFFYQENFQFKPDGVSKFWLFFYMAVFI
ncbi:hypothetical protein RND81_11G063200 [Saponaria officinalis]|uniref:Uncharacterized protein n=1 Tax=Saponaria officinalis TaxID=3572 RepID=A0AAW1HIN6_SAPOF